MADMTTIEWVLFALMLAGALAIGMLTGWRIREDFSRRGK